MWSPRHLLTLASGLLVLTATGGCQPPPGPCGGGSSVNALESGLLDAPVSTSPSRLSAAALDVEAEPARAPADSDFGDAPEVENPFGLISPAFQGLGFQSYSTACDPFDEAYGTCL